MTARSMLRNRIRIRIMFRRQEPDPVQTERQDSNKVLNDKDPDSAHVQRQNQDPVQVIGQDPDQSKLRGESGSGPCLDLQFTVLTLPRTRC
jgi:hypothetical protein